MFYKIKNIHSKIGTEPAAERNQFQPTHAARTTHHACRADDTHACHTNDAHTCHTNDAHACHTNDAHACHTNDAHACHTNDAHACRANDTHACRTNDTHACHTNDAHACHTKDTHACHTNNAHACRASSSPNTLPRATLQPAPQLFRAYAENTPHCCTKSIISLYKKKHCRIFFIRQCLF